MANFSSNTNFPRILIPIPVLATSIDHTTFDTLQDVTKTVKETNLEEDIHTHFEDIYIFNHYQRKKIESINIPRPCIFRKSYQR